MLFGDFCKILFYFFFMRENNNKSDFLRRELLKKSIWGIPTIVLLLDIMSVKAQAQTSDEGDPGGAGAPRFGKINREEKKKRSARLRPLESNVWEKNYWNRGRFWKNPFRSKDSSDGN